MIFIMKQAVPKKSLWQTNSRILPSFIRWVATFCSQHPAIVASLLIVTYLLVFQTKLLLYGDTFAEGYTEYLANALIKDWGQIFESSPTGYHSLLPTLFAKAYISAKGPIGYVDYYYRLVTVVMAVGVAGFIASKYNRAIIKSDWQRVLLSLLVVLLLFDRSIFSFINIWYLGYVPLLLIALNKTPLTRLQQIAYSIFGVLIALSKPSIVLIPFLVYRAFKTKEFVSNGLILVAVLLQTYIMFIVKPGGPSPESSVSLTDMIGAMLVGTGTMALKLLQAQPSALLIVVMDLLLIAILYLLWKRRGLIIAGLILLGLALSIYAYLLAPDGQLFQSWQGYHSIYDFSFKTQRELPIYFFLLLSAFLILPDRMKLSVKRVPKPINILLPYMLALVVCILIFRPLGAPPSSGLEGFRHSLNIRESTCVPLPIPTPPTPPASEAYDVGWFFQYYGGCTPENTHQGVNYSDFTHPLSEGIPIEIDGGETQTLKSLQFILIKRDTGSATIKLLDTSSGQVFRAKRLAKDNLGYVSFNLSGLPPRSTYKFVLSSNAPVFTTTFQDTNEIVSYPFFIGFPNLNETK